MDDGKMRAGLPLLEDDEFRLAALRAALVGGEQSGAATAFEPQAFLERMHAERAQQK